MRSSNPSYPTQNHICKIVYKLTMLIMWRLIGWESKGKWENGGSLKVVDQLWWRFILLEIGDSSLRFGADPLLSMFPLQLGYWRFIVGIHNLSANPSWRTIHRRLRRRTPGDGRYWCRWTQDRFHVRSCTNVFRINTRACSRENRCCWRLEAAGYYGTCRMCYI